MIKDKITPELKSRFIQEINKTIETGKEYGLLLCKDSNGIITPSGSTVGDKDKINFLDIKDQCQFKIQGDFHTHAPVSDMKNFIKRELPNEHVPDNTARDMTIKLYKENGTSTIMPSHGDLLGALVLKGKGEIVGTVCTSSDAEPTKMECWTAKDNIGNGHYNRANAEITKHELLRNPPHEWIRHLFKKETIDLKSY